MKAILLPALLAASVLGGCAANQTLPGPPEQALPTTPSVPAPVARAAPAEPADIITPSQHCVALAMYWEARGEGRLGMTAVGAVIMNRVASNAFPDDPCGVVYQGGETPPCQFSWWCDGKSDRPRDARQWDVAVRTAGDLLAGAVDDPTQGALFFHSTAIQRPWRRQQTARIGGHLFYR